LRFRIGDVEEEMGFPEETHLRVVASAMAISHEQEGSCVFLKLHSSIPFREINAIRNRARFRSKATAALSEIARMVVVKRLSTAKLLQFNGRSRIFTEGKKARDRSIVEEGEPQVRFRPNLAKPI
jgi:hypothetical protein